MLVTVNNVVYSIWFKHFSRITAENGTNPPISSDYPRRIVKDIPQLNNLPGVKIVEGTKCIIDIREGDQYTEIASAVVLKNNKDKPSKSYARKASLTKAFSDKEVFTVNVREAIWKAYFKNHSDLKENV